jgi:hypothetical protein
MELQDGTLTLFRIIQELRLSYDDRTKMQRWRASYIHSTVPEALLLAAGDDGEGIGAAVQVGADQVLGREQLQLTCIETERT